MTSQILLIRPKFAHNVGAAIRAASCFGSASVHYTEDRFDLNGLSRLPREERMKGYNKVEWNQVDAVRPIDEIKGYLKNGPVPVAIELVPGAQRLDLFEHPEHALYVFGPEDGGLPGGVRRSCHHFVTIPTMHCMNLAAAIYVTLYDRHAKRIAQGLESPLNIESEDRGWWFSDTLEERFS